MFRDTFGRGAGVEVAPWDEEEAGREAVELAAMFGVVVPT